MNQKYTLHELYLIASFSFDWFLLYFVSLTKVRMLMAFNRRPMSRLLTGNRDRFGGMTVNSGDHQEIYHICSDY